MREAVDIGITALLCASALTAWVLWLRHARAMLLTAPQEAALRSLLADTQAELTGKDKALRALLDNLSERLQHLDNRTKR